MHPLPGEARPAGRNSALGGGALTLAGALAGAGLALVAEAVLARALGAVEYGIFAVGLAVLRIGELIGTIGLPIAVLHFGPAWPARGLRAALGPLHRWATLRMTVAALLYGTLVTGAVAWFSPRGMAAAQAALVAALAVPALCAVDYFGSVGRALGVSWPYVVARNLTQPLLFAGLVMMLVMASPGGPPGSGAALFAWTISAWVAAGVAVASVGRVVLSLDAGTQAGAAVDGIDRRSMLRFAAPAWAVTVLYAALGWADLLLVSALLPGPAAGLYRAASVPTVLFDLFTVSINAVMARRFAQLHHAGDLAALGRVVGDSVRIGMVGAVAVVLAIVGHAPAVLALIGPGFGEARPALLLLTGAVALNCALGPLGLLLVMTGRLGTEAGCVLLALAVLVLATLLLVPTHGIAGAAAAKLLALATLSAARLYRLPTGLELHGALAAVARCGLAAGAVAVPLCSLTWPLHGVGAALSALLVGGISLLPMAWMGLREAQRLLVWRGWTSLVERYITTRTR